MLEHDIDDRVVIARYLVDINGFRLAAERHGHSAAMHRAILFMEDPV